MSLTAFDRDQCHGELSRGWSWYSMQMYAVCSMHAKATGGNRNDQNISKHIKTICWRLGRVKELKRTQMTSSIQPQARKETFQSSKASSNQREFVWLYARHFQTSNLSRVLPCISTQVSFRLITKVLAQVPRHFLKNSQHLYKAPLTSKHLIISLANCARIWGRPALSLQQKIHWNVFSRMIQYASRRTSRFSFGKSNNITSKFKHC